jgi:hypothetical protein
MKRPPHTTDHEGNPRTIGIEAEFSGLTLEEIAATVIDTFGGELEQGSRYRCKVVGHRFAECGPFRIELDASLLKDERLGETLGKLGIRSGDLSDMIERLVERSALHVVPMEVVTPPLPLDRLPELEELRKALLRKAVKDTHSAWFHAFGLHLNPAVPSVRSGDLRDLLQAFLLLYDWLVERLKVDRARQLTPFIAPFPGSYQKLILDPGYDPDLASLIDDYLRHNATRNRPLDMLPLFTWLDRERVLAAIDDGLTTARPAYHYRLPNCNIADPEWTFAREWNHWVVVENLAEDKQLLQRMTTQWAYRHNHPLEHWLEQVRQAVGRWF